MELPKRKIIRLKDYDYSQDGLYFVTICAKDKMNLFGAINKNQELENAVVNLSDIGKIAEKHLIKLQTRYSFIKIHSYIIMPNHIHTIIEVLNETDKKEELSRIIQAYKSLVSKECREVLGIYKLFQRSYYDHIIKNEKELEKTVFYIIQNPGRWIYDKYYSDGTIAT